MSQVAPSGSSAAAPPASPISGHARLELGDMSSVNDVERSPLINEDVAHRTYDGRPADSWEFAGFGARTKIDDLVINEEAYRTEQEQRKQHHLGQFLATAISGNDITSSCLYTIGVCLLTAGRWAPVSLALVAFVLVLYQRVYSEVGSAIPMNGGAYNALLNTSTKATASVAAALTILSYIATAVTSADTAIQYLNFLLNDHANGYQVNPLWASIVLLAIFAVLNMIGIGESAIVAFVIFAVHVVVLAILSVAGLVSLFRSDYSVLLWNWNSMPNINTAADIYFGFSVAMLGVSGYETSSNYIEEQKPGVFPKTLRNMAIIVGICNPILAFLCVALVRYPGAMPPLPVPPVPMAPSTGGNFTDSPFFSTPVVEYPPHVMTGNMTMQQAQRVLATLGNYAGGDWLGWLVSIDAIIVLSGSVLTAYVGVTGLVRRMSLDRCLPQFLLHENPWRHTNHWIIIGFFLVCTSLYELVNAQVDTISGVYTVAFLSVLALFSVGNLLLKYKRSRLPRDVRAPVVVVILAGGLVVAALVGNAVLRPEVLKWFSIYFSVTLFIVIVMLTRTRILRWIDKSVIGRCCGAWIHRQVAEINRQEMVFFAKDDNLEVLNKAVLYVRDNELTNCFRIVHLYESEDRIPPRLEEYVDLLDRMYPKLKIDLTLVKGSFTPAVVAELAHRLDVPRNFMYLTCPSDRFPHKISEFGGVRVITH